MSKKKDRVLLGVVAVDSGQLLICDPCYIDLQWEREEFTGYGKAKNNFSYAACCDVTSGCGVGGQLKFALGHDGIGVAFSSGYGDGAYNVYATYIDEGMGRRIAKVEIEMITAKESRLATQLLGRSSNEDES